MKSIYLVCHLIFLIAVYSSPHHIKPGLEPANKTASWVLLGKHWRAESNVPHHAVAKVGNMPQVVSPALGRYRLNSQGLIHNQPDSDGPYRIVINNPGFALINPGINREYNVSELLLQDILAVWLYEPSLRSYRVYRPNGVYLPSEHRLQTIAPGWPLFVETASYQASLSFKDFTTEFVVDGGANGLSSSPNLMFRPVSQTVLGYSWPLESAGQIHTGPLKEIRYLLEASPGIATGLRFSLYFETVSGRTKIAGADLHGVLVREFPVEVPETESVKLLAVIEDSYGREIVSQSLLIQPGFKTGFNLQTELARILNPDLGKSNNIRASVSSLNTGFSEAPGNFLQGDLQHIVVSISGSGISSQSTEFPGTTTSATLQIPVGNNRNIRVDYLDSTRSLIRSGQRTLNVTSAISNLTLEPAPTIFPELISFPASGYFAESFPVTLVASGAEILYTLDNSNPKSSSSVISAMGTTSVQITQSTTIQAFVRLPNSQTSGVRYFTFIKEAPPVPVFTASVPENYSNQFFAGSQIVLVSGSGAAGEKIRLADGNTFPLPYSLGLSQTTTFVFQTISPNGVRSSDYSFTFTQVELPELTYEIATASIQQFFAGTATIVLNSSVEGTELFYTLDDSTPDLQSASLLLPAQIELSDSATLRGFVRHPIGFIGSEFAYGFVKVPLPDPESLPDGYELEFGEVASIPFELGENIVVSVHTEPTQGILNLTQSLVEYTPNSGFFGEDFFVLEFLHEPTGLYFAKGFTMIVNEEPNQAPFISLLSPLSTDEDTNLDVSVSYSDPDGDELLFTADFMPAELGSVSVVGNLVSFVPGPNQSGTGNLLLTVCETSTSDQYCVTQSVSLTVAAVDDVPTLIVSDTSVVFDRNTTTSITFSVLELDGDSVNLAAVAYTGTVTDMVPSSDLGFVIENGALTIIPAPNFYGSVMAGLQVCDATAENLCHFAEIAVTVNFVNQPPHTGYSDAEVLFSLLEDNFYSNAWMFSDPEGLVVTPFIVSSASHGTIVLDSFGFTYTPAADFNGTDGFTLGFLDEEGGQSELQFVVTVNPVADAPQVFLNQAGVEIFSVVLDEDSSQNYTIVVTDADGDLIQVTASTEASVALTVSGGVLSVVPAPNWHGSGVIQVVACDNNQDSLCAEVDYLLTVNSVNDEPEFEGRDYVWNVVGAAGVSPAAGQNPSLAVDSQGLVYVSYQDLSVSNAISVKKFDGSSWVQVGSPNVSGGSQHFSSLAFDNNDVLYLAYSGAPSQIGVKRFNGSSWEDVALTSPGSGSYVKLLFDSSNQLYLAFSNSGLSNRASVMTLNGSDWEFVGSQAISPETAQHLNLVADPSGVLHISYRDLQGASRTGVRKFDGSDWVDVGNPSTMITYPLQSSLAFDSQGTPYVAFVDNTNTNKATVMKLNGSTWELVGPRAFTPAAADYPSLLINSDDKLFLVFKDSSQAGKVSAMTWDSENWVYAGTPGVSAGDGYHHTAIIDAWDRIYTAFRDDGTSSRTTVFSMQSGPILTAVLENSSYVTTLVASDEDADILSYSIVTGLDGTVFTVDSISGELSFINPPDYENPLDSNSDNVYELMVMVSDGNGGSTTQSIIVQVIGVDEAPVISPVADLNLDEDYGSHILDLPTVDPEGDLITLTLTSSNPGVVTVASANGTSFILTSPQDVFGESIMTLVANSTDKSTTLTFLVTVNPVNDVPMPIGVGSGSLTFVGTNPYLDTVTGEFPAVAFNSLGIPYVAFHDLSSGGVNVKKFVNGEWILVGPANLSSGGASWIEIAIHSDDTVFVAYEDLDYSNQISVRKFNGTNWELVGSRGFSAESADHVSLQIDSNGYPWVAYRGQAGSYLANVRKFDGTNWSSPDVMSAGRADLPRLVLDRNNKAFVAFQDFVNGERIRVMAKEPAQWVSLPLNGLPTGAVQFPSMTVDSRNRLWLAFKDFQNGGGATVARFEGTHWEIIGTAGIGNIVADWIDLKLDSADVPYIIFNDAGDSSRARMFSFQSGAWIEPTGGVISPFYSERTRLAIGPKNQVVAVYRDYQVRIVANEFRELGWSAYAEENQSLALSLNADDVENQALTYSLQGGPDVSLFEISGNQLLFLSPPDFENPSDSDADGTYLLNVSVSDGLSSVTVPVRIMVKNVDEAPILYGLEDLALSEDFGFFVVVPTLFDLEGDTMTVTVQSSNVAVVQAKLVQGKYILLNSVQDSYGPALIEVSVSSYGLSTTVTFMVDVSPVADELMVLNERVSTWPVLGSAGFSAGAAEYHSLVIAPDGMPVVSYRDSSFAHPLAVVRKWDGSTWTSVGTAGFSSQSAPYHTLAYDSSGVLHLSYQDGGHSGKATLMRFENGAWNTVGSPGFTPGESTHVKLAFDTNDVPYVAFRDVQNGGKASILRFIEGQWSNVFLAYISTGNASFISLDIDPLNRPVIAYRDELDSGRTWVHRLEDGVWKHLNTEGNVLTTNAAWQSIKIDRFATPYLAYIDQTAADLVLARYNEVGGWEELARSPVAAGTDEKYVTLLIDNRDQIYVSLRNSDLNSGDTVVLKYVNNALQFVGPNTGINTDDTRFTAMAVDPDGKLYLAYRDIKISNRTTVRHQELGPIVASVLENQHSAVNIEGFFPDGGLLEYAIVGGPDQNHFVIDSSGQVEFVTAPDYEYPLDANVLNMYEFSVQMNSGNVYTTVPVRVIVENVDEAPVLSPITSPALNEDFGPHTVTLSAFDPEGDSITYIVNSLNPDIVSTPVVSGNVLIFTPVPDAYGTAAIQVTAISQGGFDIQTFYQTVSPVNDAPSVTNTLHTTWAFLGGTNMTETSVNNHLGFVLNQTNVPYVAFSDNAWSGRMTVKRYEEGSWDTVGTGGFSAGVVSFSHLVMDNNDDPWVGYMDSSNGNGATVMRFDGSSWVGVGAAGFTSSVNQLSFALSPTSTPYVAYSDSSSGLSKISVKKYTGSTWVFVGDTLVRQEAEVSMDFPAIAIAPDGTPYLLYRHSVAGVHEEVASVMKFDGTTWAQVGIIGFSGSPGIRNIYDPFITVRSDGVPVISYRDRGSPPYDRASVLYFDGSAWIPFGPLGFSEGSAMLVKVALDSKGMPWASYKDQTLSDSAVVKRFDGNSWLPVGAPAITDGSADFLHIAITSEDVPLIAYRQAGNSKPAVKMAESFLRYVVAENSSFSTTIGVFDVDGDTDFTFSLQGADSSFFTIGTSSGELTLNNPLNFEVPVDQNSDGAYTFEVRVSDASGAFITAPVRVFVEDVNEAPKLELYSDSGLSTPVTTWVIIEDWDSQAQQLYFVVNEEDGQSYTLTVLNAGETSFGNVWEYGPGVWELMGAQTFTPGTTSFTVEICDDSDPVLCNQVEIDIEAIEYQSPVITANPTSFNVFEGGSVNVPYEIQSFGPDFTFTVSVEPDYGFVTLDNTLSGVITYQSALEHTGVVTFTVEFNDGFESTSLEFTVMVQAPPPTMFEIGLDSTSLKLDVANQLYADYGYMGEPQSETWTLLEYPTGANTTDLQVEPVDGELATLTPTVPGRYRVRFDLMDEQSSSHFLEAEFITRDEWVAKPALAEEGFDGSLQMAGSANSIYARYMNASNELEVKKFDSVSWTESTLPYSSPAGMTVVGETVYIAYQYNSKIEIHRSNDNTAYEQVGQSLPYSTMVALGHNLSEDVFVCLQGGTLAVQCYKFDGNHWIKAGDEFAVATPTITYAQLISHENQMYYSAIHYSTLESRDIPVLYSYDGNAWNEETILVDPVITTTVLSYKAGFIGDQLWAMVAETDGIHIARHELGVGGMTPFDFSIPDLVHADMLVDNRGDIYLAYLHGSVSTDLAIKRFQIIENDWEDMTYPTDESMISINSGLVALARLSGVPHLAISDSSDSGILGFYALERTATPLVINHYPITMNSSVAGNEITLGFSKELPTTAHIGAVSLKNELNGDGFYNASITNTDGEAVLLLELTSNLEAGLRYTVEAGSTRVGGPAFIEDYQDINAPPFRFDFLTKAPYQILTGDMNREPSRNPSIAVAKQGNNLEIYVSAIEISSDLVTGTKYANGSWSHMETNISASAAVTSTPWIGIGLNKKPVITLRDTNHRIQAHAWTGSSWSNLVADQGSPDLFGDPSGHHVLASGFAPAVGLLPTHDYLYVMTRMTSSNGLKVASMANDGTWSLLGGTIDTVEGDDFAIAVGQDGNPVVVYRDYSNSDVQIKSWDGSSWSHVTASAPFGADSPNRMLQIEALGNGFIVVGGLDEVSNDFWLWAFDGSNWGDYEAPDQLVTQVHHYDMAFVDQTLFLVVSDANASTTIFYRRGTDSNWLEVNSFPRSDLESPRFGSDGKNLYLIGNDPIVDELLVYKLEPIDG